MRIYFDFEFCSLRDPVPISIGCAAADGTDYYAELADGWTPELCSDWTRANVLPVLEGKARTRSTIRSDLLEFLAGYPEGGLLICDHLYDRNCLTALLEPPPGWRLKRAAYTLNSHGDSYFHPGMRRHHAADDARALAGLMEQKFDSGEDFLLFDDF